MARLAAASSVGYVGGWRSDCGSAGRCYWHGRPIVYLRFRNDADQTSISQSAGAAGNRGRRLAGAAEKRRVVRRFRCARRTTGAERRNRESVRLANETCGRRFADWQETKHGGTGGNGGMSGSAAADSVVRSSPPCAAATSTATAYPIATCRRALAPLSERESSPPQPSQSIPSAAEPARPCRQLAPPLQRTATGAAAPRARKRSAVPQASPAAASATAAAVPAFFHPPSPTAPPHTHPP